MELIDEIITSFEQRNIISPDNVWQALGFANTELGEVYELLLDREKTWVRNHPENKPKFSKEALGEELGDVILMIMLAGWIEGVNPIQALREKLQRKLEKLNSTKNNET